MNKIKIIISGGGTGGHIFPAISIANALKEKLNNEVDILFVGAKGKMEMEKVPAAGYPIEALWISGLQRKLSWQNLILPFKILSSFIKAHFIIQKYKPQVVVGVGGYASAIIMKVANQYGIPTLIQEQNSYPGITNKMLAGGAKKICVAYKNMDKFFSKEKIIYTGNPIRKNLIDIDTNKQNAYIAFGLDINKQTILIIGGSLGALTINKAIENNLKKINTDTTQIIWQTGKGYFTKADVHKNNNIKVFEFIANMNDAYNIADIIISRAGAGTISELCVIGKPIILIPSPNVAEDHQTKNAMALVNENAAILVKDNEAEKKLIDTALNLLNDNAKKEELKIAIKKLAMPDAANNIALEVLKLVKK